MDPSEQVEQLLKEHGAVLKRHKKHEVWKLPNGETFIRPKSPSDTHSHANNLMDLRRLLGINNPERGKPGERREHLRTQRNISGSKLPSFEPINNALANQLRATGLVEESLQHKIACLTGQVQMLQKQFDSCWMCRFRHWLKLRRRWIVGWRDRRRGSTTEAVKP